MLKKLLTITLVLVGALTLAGCEQTPEGPSDLEKIAEALVQIEQPSTTSTDLTFPATGLHDVTITWESNNTDVIANDGTVTIPTFTAGNKTVEITAFVTIGENTLTKKFDITVNAATVKTDAELAQDAYNALLIADTLVMADITLVSSSLDASVSWVSDKPAYLAADGTVTRPAEGAANEVVTLTATIISGSATLTKTFEITVVAEETGAVFTTVQSMYDTAVLGDYVEFTGIVVALFDGGYFLTDGTHSIGVYHRGIAVELGDKVHLKGFYAVYNTLYQISGLTEEEVISQDNANPLTPMVKTVAEIAALDASVKNIHGMPYTVTGVLEFRQSGSYTNLFLVDGDAAFQIYHYSLEDSLEVLEGLVGREVTITGTYYTQYNKTGIVYFAFDGAESDITLKALEGQEALDSTQAALDGFAVKITNGDDIVLPTDGGNNVVLSGWTSSDAAVLANDGKFVALDTETVVITFTATATAPAVGTNPAMTQEVTLDIVVPVNSTIAEVLSGDTEDYFQVTGVVYDLSYYGAFIEDNGSYIFVYGKSLKDDYVVGDELIILGSRSMYSGLYQVMIEDIEKGTTGNDLVTAVPSTVTALMNDLVPRGTIATVTGTVEEITVGDYTDVYVTDPSGAKVKVYYRSNVDELEDHLGTVVTLDLVAYQNGTVLYQGMKADAVAATFTAEDKAQIALDMIMFEEKVFDDITLAPYYTFPFAEGATVVNFSWVSDTPASITDMGVVTQMQDDVTVTFTVTATLGTVTLTRDVEVVVAELPLTVTEALALDFDADPSIVTLVTGVVSAVFDTSWGQHQVIIQDPVTGAAIYVDDEIEDAKVGDSITVRGLVEFYTSYGNEKKQIDNVSYYVINSSDNDVTIETVTPGTGETVEGLIADAYKDMKTYTATLTIKEFYGDWVIFEGSDTREIRMSMSEFAPYMEDVYVVTDSVEVTFTVLDNYSGDTRIIGAMLPELTAAQNMLAVKGMIMVPGAATIDLVLPVAFEDYDATIVWTTDTAAALTAAGVVTRNEYGGGDVAVVLTATVSVTGATDEVLTFNVNVPEYPMPELFISEYIEGGSNNKAIEIYNPTDAAVDLSVYSIIEWYNETGSNTQALTGTLASGEVLVLCADQANADILAVCDMQLAYPSVSHFNGNDTLQLLKNGVVIDQIGVQANAGGSDFWKDNTYVRKAVIFAPTTSWSEAEWTEFDKDTVSNLGSHTCDRPTS